jgi:hypothetical protein
MIDLSLCLFFCPAFVLGDWPVRSCRKALSWPSVVTVVSCLSSDSTFSGSPSVGFCAIQGYGCFAEWPYLRVFANYTEADRPIPQPPGLLSGRLTNPAAFHALRLLAGGIVRTRLKPHTTSLCSFSDAVPLPHRSEILKAVYGLGTRRDRKPDSPWMMQWV